MFQSIILSLLLFSSQPAADYSCVDEYANHPVRNEFMLQIVLKSYNYYKGEIDGEIGPLSLNALKDFQRSNNAVAVSYTHLRAHETREDLVCRLLLEKKKQTSSSIAMGML